MKKAFKRIEALTVWVPLIIIVLFFQFCQDPAASTGKNTAQLILSADTVIIYDTSSISTVVISSSDPSPLEWKLIAKPSWVAISPTAGTAPNNGKNIYLYPYFDSIAAGQYIGKVIFASAFGDEKELVVKGVLRKNALLDFSDSVISVQSHQGPKVFTLTNTSAKQVAWVVATSNPWLSFYPISGELAQGASTSVTIEIRRSLVIQSGTYKDTMVIGTQPMRNEYRIPVFITTPFHPDFSMDMDSILFDYDTDSIPLMVRNTGSEVMQWNASSSDDFLKVIPTSGMIPLGDSMRITAIIHRDQLRMRNYTPSFSITDGFGVSRTVKTLVRNYKEDKWHLDFVIRAHAYDRKNDRLLFATDEPSGIHIIDLNGKKNDFIPTDYIPYSIAVSADGRYAAAGNDFHVTSINLEKKKVEKVYRMPDFGRVSSLIYSSTGWIYAFQGGPMIMINTSTHQILSETSKSINSEAVGVIDPAEEYLYAATGSYDLSLIRFALTGGIAGYRSSISENSLLKLWMNDNGDRLISGSGNVFVPLTKDSIALVFEGSISDRVHSFSQPKNSDKMYALTSFDKITVFNAITLRKRYEISIPPFRDYAFPEKTVLIPGRAHSIFVDNTLQKMYVLEYYEEVKNDVVKSSKGAISTILLNDYPR